MERSGTGIDLRSYLRVITKRRWTILTFFIVVVLSVAIHTFTATPIYQATARIVIEKENQNVVSIQEVLAVDSTGQDYYQTQYKIIESRSVAREVIKRLSLDQNPEFLPEPAEGLLGGIKTWYRDTRLSVKEWAKNLFVTGQPAKESRKRRGRPGFRSGYGISGKGQGGTGSKQPDCGYPVRGQRSGSGSQNQQ